MIDEPTSEPEVVTDKQREFAASLLRKLYGCGVPESMARVEKISDDVVRMMIAAENESRRDKIPAILSRHT